MSRKNRKQQKTKKAKKAAVKGKHIMTIPELRRAFEHVETFVEIHASMPKQELVQAFQKEWRLTFKKEVDEEGAKAYVEHALSEIPKKHPKHRRHHGGAVALQGAPLLGNETRAGVYTSPGVNEHSYAQVPTYVDKGFQNPEVARSYDPVVGQTHYVTRTPIGMGSNQAGGSKTKTKKRKQGGGSFMSVLAQTVFNPFAGSDIPSSPLKDTGSYLNAIQLPESPDASQRHPNYKTV